MSVNEKLNDLENTVMVLFIALSVSGGFRGG